MNVEQLVPARVERTVQDIAAGFGPSDAYRRRPIDAQVLDLCVRMSTRLFEDAEARRHPELQALAFWMRKAELRRLHQAFAALESPSVTLVPRGTVFHIPPANVDTMFVYSWLLSVLVGNRNVVRLSSRQTPQTAILLRVLNEGLSHDGARELRDETCMVSYPHDLATTSALTAVCDVRVIWGGDRTIDAVRQAPLPPNAKDVTFADRYSMSAIATQPYLALSDSSRTELAKRFYNDAFWFNQLGCSSPRLIVWVGTSGDVKRSAALFRQSLLEELRRRHFEVDSSTAMHKLTFAYRAAIDLPITETVADGNELRVMTLKSLDGFDRSHPGAGFFFDVRIDDLNDLVSFVSRRDQTMTHFGFTPEALSGFARALNGRGIDRLVPIGQALSFDRFWDGYDLLQEFVRRVVISTADAVESPASAVA